VDSRVPRLVEAVRVFEISQGERYEGLEALLIRESHEPMLEAL
jgi:hypothetical protein